MKNPYGSVLLVIFSPSQIAVAQNYQLVWSAEFNGSQVNTSIWDIRNDDNVQNNELEYYTNRPSNLTVSNGMLVITALKEEYGGKHYTSARLSTKLSWQSGRIVASNHKLSKAWSFHPNAHGTRIKCAELETGMNSVSPWMTPNKIAFSNNIGSVSFNHSRNGLHRRRWTKNSMEETDGSKSCRLASHSRRN